MAGLFLTVVLFQAAPARAEVVFDFSGTCELNCLGTASGILTLADSYVFGTLITDAEFGSFDYSSSSRSFDIISADDPGLIGGLNADGSFFTGEVVFADAGNTPAFIATGNGFEAITEQDSNTNDFGSLRQTPMTARRSPSLASAELCCPNRHVGDDGSWFRWPWLCWLSQSEAGGRRRRLNGGD